MKKPKERTEPTGLSVSRIDSPALRVPRLERVDRRERKPPRIMTTDEAARFLRISSNLLRELVLSDAVPFRKVGRRFLFSRRLLVEWVENKPR